MSRPLEVCPECHYTLIEKTTYCPYCGIQLTHPTWKKVAAWFILILIVWGLVKCHVRLFQGGLEDFFEEGGKKQGEVRGSQLAVGSWQSLRPGSEAFSQFADALDSANRGLRTADCLKA